MMECNRVQKIENQYLVAEAIFLLAKTVGTPSHLDHHNSYTLKNWGGMVVVHENVCPSKKLWASLEIDTTASVNQLTTRCSHKTLDFLPPDHRLVNNIFLHLNFKP